MVPLQLYCETAKQTVQPQTPAFSAGAFALINHLRFVAMGCRAKRRTDLFKACALLAVDKTTSVDAHADALMRCLGEALGKPARLHAPGTAELTFDERWLIQLATAYARKDTNSTRFLLASRVAFENRRLVGFLIGRIADRLALD